MKLQKLDIARYQIAIIGRKAIIKIILKRARSSQCWLLLVVKRELLFYLLLTYKMAINLATVYGRLYNLQTKLSTFGLDAQKAK